MTSHAYKGLLWNFGGVGKKAKESGIRNFVENSHFHQKEYQLFYRDFQFDANKTQKITMQIFDIWSKVQHLCIETCQVGDLEIIWRLCLK